MKSMRLLSALLMAGVFVLAACSDDEGTGPGGNGGADQGFIRAEFSGGYSGSFSASGRDMGKRPAERTEVAGAAHLEGEDEGLLVITGALFESDQSGEPNGDILNIWIRNPRVGTYTTGDFCLVDLEEDDDDYEGDEFPDDCAIIAVFNTYLEDSSIGIIFSSGTFQITAMDGGRIRGEFQMEGEGFRVGEWEWSVDDGMIGEEEALGRVSARDGAFDLRLYNDLSNLLIGGGYGF